MLQYWSEAVTVLTQGAFVEGHGVPLGRGRGVLLALGTAAGDQVLDGAAGQYLTQGR